LTRVPDLLRKHGGKPGAELNVIIAAAKKRDIEAVKQHLADGADVNEKAGDGTTPLHTAAVYGHNEVAELLIANGAEVNAKNVAAETPLHHAARHGHKEIGELLTAGGADVNAKKDYGDTSLDWAIMRNHTEIANLLHKHGGKHSTINTAAGGDTDAVKEFLAAGADVNAKDKFGQTPLDRAVFFKKKETADLLRKHGAKTGEELKAEGK